MVDFQQIGLIGIINMSVLAMIVSYCILEIVDVIFLASLNSDLDFLLFS